MKRQLEAMLVLQDRMNRRVHEDWIERDFAWYRALWLECGELVDHYGYKWWKKQVPDMAQVRLEVVDIWHFGLSMLFDGRSVGQMAQGVMDELGGGSVPRRGVLEAAESLAACALTERRFGVLDFFSLLQAAGMTFEELFLAYIGKNVLNVFRQDHGYREGSYRKLWAGREDNEHLLEIAGGLEPSAEDFPERLYAGLQERYRATAADAD